MLPQVSPIVEQVRSRGDAAVKEYTEKFDRVSLECVCSPIEVRGASAKLATLPVLHRQMDGVTGQERWNA